MTRTSFRRVLRLGLGLGVMLGMFGCAQEREPIVRVQPNALDKSFFIGALADSSDDPEFYWRGYVTDGSSSQEQIGVGSWSHVDRIRWEVTEDRLIAHKAYPLFTQPNDPGKFSGPDNTGTVVAAYRITSHFDIRRSYNPSTGEEQNVIEENNYDRPWYERQYMRVDWSSNIVNDPMWMDMFAGTIFGDIKVSPLVYNVTDPVSDDAPHFEPEDGYFDVTNRFYLESPEIWIWGFSAPACWIYGLFTGGATYECNPQEATVRFSFKKVDPNHDFEPLETGAASLDIVGNPGGLGDSFSVGIVTAPRQGFDPAYGFTDKNTKFFANIHNIWERSHQDGTSCDWNGDENADGTADQCANDVTGYSGSSGSQCDIHMKKCTIPYRDRTVKPVAYWVNNLMPLEFQDRYDSRGFENCNGSCAVLSTDPQNCGSCGNQCAEGEVCSGGECQQGAACKGGLTDCDGTCVNTGRDPQNCGTCGHACGDGKVCMAHICQDACGEGWTQCGNSCVPTYEGLPNEPDNCGECGNVCSSGSCSQGVCNDCPDESEMCGDSCVNTSGNDPMNCGGCNQRCDAGQGCYQGHCQSECGPFIPGASEDIVYSWNQLMRTSVGRAREVECRRTNEGDRTACHDQFFAPASDRVMVSYGAWLVDKPHDDADVLVLCHNPVRENDNHDACGPTGATARTGDIRKHMIVYWPYESRAPWGGIANWNGDPLTGEIIGGAALVMGRSVRYGSAFARDVLQVAMGDVSLEELIDGLPQNMHFSPNAAMKTYQTAQLSAQEIQSRIKAVDAKHAMQSSGVQALAGNSMADQMASYAAQKASSVYDFASESAATSRFDAIASPLHNTTLESNLMTSSWIRGATGMGPDVPVNADIMGFASPLRTLDPGKLRILRDKYRAGMETRGACFFDNEAPAVGSVNIPGLAKYFKDAYSDAAIIKEFGSKANVRQKRGEKIYDHLLAETYKGIAIHEIGHSLGMLHQFASSWDATNFSPQYWQLRTNEGNASGSCNGQPRTGDTDSCMGPRYLDGETADEMGFGDESRPGIDYFASTSTMEYQWERFGETAGLGTYDLYTMSALYGRVLETMDPNVLPVSDQERFGPRMRSQLDEQENVVQNTAYGNFPQPMHYTELARQLKIFDPNRDCRPVSDDEKRAAKWRIVHNKVCAPTPRDYAAWSDFVSDRTFGGDPASVAHAWHTPGDARLGGGNVRWFHRWGSTNNSYMHTNPSDAGADPYEVARNTARKFDAMYPFGYFRRHNREYAWWNVPGSVASVYFDRERSFHWHSAIKSAQYMRSFGETKYNEMAQSDDWLRPYLMASTEAFNLLYRAAMMPQPGVYYALEDRRIPGWQKGKIYDTTDSPPQFAFEAFTLKPGDARFIDDNFDSNPNGGGSWQYTNWMIRAGFEVEKAYAIALLTDGRPPVYTPSRDIFLDPRLQSASFYADMPHAIDRLMAGIMSEDWETIGMSANADGQLAVFDITQPTAPDRPTGTFAVFPNMGFNQQSVASIYAAVYSRESGDMTLMNKMRIWIEGVDGNIGTIGFPNPNEQVRFFNPLSGFTYIARKYGPEQIAGKTVDKGIGSRMLQYANWILAGTYKVEMEADNKTPVFDQYGQVKLVLGTDGQPQLIDEDSANTRMNQFLMYVGMIDGTRQIGVYLGDGPM